MFSPDATIFRRATGKPSPTKLNKFAVATALKPGNRKPSIK
jgi:hypothetical protein